MGLIRTVGACVLVVSVGVHWRPYRCSIVVDGDLDEARGYAVFLKQLDESFSGQINIMVRFIRDKTVRLNQQCVDSEEE